MGDTPDYGLRLTVEEYVRRVVGLYRGLAPEPPRVQIRKAPWLENTVRIRTLDR